METNENLPIALQEQINSLVDLKVSEKLKELEAKLASLEAKVDAPKKVTIILTSNDFDRVLPAYIIATGAASFGMDVTIFFTLWGLTTLRDKKIYKGKKITEKMFTMMMPKDVTGIGLSKMNMMGAGAAMMKGMLKDNNVATIPELIQISKEMGVKLIACQMTMGIMGITEEEMFKGVEYGGVAVYLEKASEAGINLFI